MENYFIRNMNFFDINPVESGYEVCKPGHVFGYAVRRHYLIHYVVRGTGVLYKNDREYQVNKGQAFLIKPGEATKYCADLENPWE